jgi:hypothetical protein
MIVLAIVAGAGVAGGLSLLAADVWDVAATRARRSRDRGRLVLSRIRTERLALSSAGGVVMLVVSHWPVGAVAVAAAAWWVPCPHQRSDRRDSAARTEALAQWCASLRDAAGTARGIEGILMATAPAAPAPIRAEVGRMATRLEAQRLGTVLDRLADDLDHPIGDLVVTALRLASKASSRRVRSVLGDLATAAELEASMHRRVDVARQRPRSTMQLVAVIITAFVAGLVVFARDYLAPYSTVIGQLVLAGIAFYWAAGFWWMARLGRLPAPRRFMAPGGNR